MTGLVGATASFVESSELLKELAGLATDPKQVERSAEALGHQIAADERRVIAPEPSKARTPYLEPDGTVVPVRKTETHSRKGKQRDGAAKTREAKIAAVWSTDARDQHGTRPVIPAPSPTTPPSRPSPSVTPIPNSPLPPK